MTFTDDKSFGTDFLVIILNPAQPQRARINHYLKPFKIAGGIQLCQCDLAGMMIFNSQQNCF